VSIRREVKKGQKRKIIETFSNVFTF
jgi:hypothetical protein